VHDVTGARTNVNVTLAVVRPNTHSRRRRDLTRQLHRVGVGGVYWALDPRTINKPLNQLINQLISYFL